MPVSWGGVGEFFGDIFEQAAPSLINIGADWLNRELGGGSAGSPRGVNRYQGYVPPIRPSLQYPRPPGSLNPMFGVPSTWTPIPAVPASQPFGVRPGSEFMPLAPGGDIMPGFPTTRYSSFPQVTPSSFGLAGLGGAVMRQLPAIGAGLGLGELMESFQGGGGGAAGGTPMFKPTQAGYTAQTFRAQNPSTGQDVFFRPAGRPILWSSDLSACKRVKKIARRAYRKR